MLENIVAAVLTLIVIASGIWCWWVDNGGTFRIDGKKKVKETKEEA